MNKLIMIAILLTACGDNLIVPTVDACPTSPDAPTCALIRRRIPGLERALPTNETVHAEIALPASDSRTIVTTALVGSFPCLTVTLATDDVARCHEHVLADGTAGTCSMLLAEGGTRVQIDVATCGLIPSIVTIAEVIAAPL